jgi:HSP20 family protein
LTNLLRVPIIADVGVGVGAFQEVSRMRLGSLLDWDRDFDDMARRFFGPEFSGPLAVGAYDVPTDVFRTEDGLVVRMELAGVKPEDVEATIQDNVLVINGKRHFPWDPDKVRFLQRGTFYGEFTKRIALGKGLNPEPISAHYDNGVLELRIPYTDEVQPKKIEIEVGERRTQLTS